jgi:hypothetical protein
MNVTRWTLPLIVAGAALGLPAGAAAKPAHKCAAVTIGNDSFTHVVAKGVTCTYARTVFIPAINMNNELGWAAFPPKHVSSTEVKDRYGKGKKRISFTLTFP